MSLLSAALRGSGILVGAAEGRKEEAILADTSTKRTARDQATISTKVLAKKSAAEAAKQLSTAKRRVKKEKARHTIGAAQEMVARERSDDAIRMEWNAALAR